MYLFLQPIPFQAWLAADCAKTSGVHKISPLPFYALYNLVPITRTLFHLLNSFRPKVWLKGSSLHEKKLLCQRDFGHSKT